MKTLPTIKAHNNSTCLSQGLIELLMLFRSSVINCPSNIGIASQINIQYLPIVKQSLWCPTAKVLVIHSFTLFTFPCYRMDRTILFLSETKLIEIATITGTLFNKLLGLQWTATTSLVTTIKFFHLFPCFFSHLFSSASKADSLTGLQSWMGSQQPGSTSIVYYMALWSCFPFLWIGSMCNPSHPKQTA